ncbi:4Fe-4S binding protein [Halobacteriaceae archaeon GCM10025711]
MQANYGYSDGAGDWYVTVDTDACDGCGECVAVCPADLWELQADEFDPLSDDTVATIEEARRGDLRYACSPCKSPEGDGDGSARCAETCHVDAISFSW